MSSSKNRLPTPSPPPSRALSRSDVNTSAGELPKRANSPGFNRASRFVQARSDELREDSKGFVATPPTSRRPNTTKFNSRTLLCPADAAAIDFRAIGIPLPPIGTRRPNTESIVLQPAETQAETPLLPRSMDDSEEVAIAIRLPGGKRVEETFRTSDKVATLVALAAKRLGRDEQRIALFKPAPRQQLENLEQSLLELGIESKTMLYAEEI